MDFLKRTPIQHFHSCFLVFSYQFSIIYEQNLECILSSHLLAFSNGMTAVPPALNIRLSLKYELIHFKNVLAKHCSTYLAEDVLDLIDSWIDVGQEINLGLPFKNHLNIILNSFLHQSMLWVFFFEIFQKLINVGHTLFPTCTYGVRYYARIFRQLPHQTLG